MVRSSTEKHRESDYMRLKLLLPDVKPNEFSMPKECPTQGCKGKRFSPRQEVQKRIVDAQYSVVSAWRCECASCGCTFRVYPQGVGSQQISHRVLGLAIMLYVLGLSYEAVSLVLITLGIGIGKSSVYRTVQAAAEKVPGMKQKEFLNDYRTGAVGADLTSVRCKGKWLHLAISVDAVNGMTLSLDNLSGEDAETLKAWLVPILDAVDADVVVSDDADAFKIVSDESGRSHQVCKSHVGRNTDALVESLSNAIRAGKDRSLKSINISDEQALADLEKLKTLIHTRRPEDQEELEKLYLRYADARKPSKGKTFSVAYRMRNLFLDSWTLWPRLTFSRTWMDEDGNLNLDGTNNHCERSIGWWVKERYRTMRGYKRDRSAVNVSRLLAWCGNYLDRGGADLGLLVS